MNSNTEERLYNIVSRIATALMLLFISILWGQIQDLSKENQRRDKELAEFMLQIEHRLTIVEERLKND